MIIYTIGAGFMVIVELSVLDLTFSMEAKLGGGAGLNIDLNIPGPTISVSSSSSVISLLDSAASFVAIPLGSTG